MRLANVAGRAALIVDGRTVDVERASGGRLPSDPMAVIARLDEVRELSVDGHGDALDEALLEAPVPRPQKILGAGINYRLHAAEAGFDLPDAPALFAKLPSAVAGPYQDVEIPAGRTTVDWEAELVVVIGRRARRIRESDAWSYVAGLTCGQDISDREEQFRSLRQFTMGKSYDTYAPIGPFLVTPDEFDDPDDLEVRCTVDGEEVQRGRTVDFIFSVSELVSWASQLATLEAGDLFFTGTPSGVGYIRKPPRYLRPGSVLATEIEGIGRLVNTCIAVDAAAPLSRDGVGIAPAVGDGENA